MEIPAELKCPLCGYLLEDAVMLPCCAASACTHCTREGLDVSDGHCPIPDCPEPEGISAEDLIPNRQLRAKAATFKERNPTAPTRPATKKTESVAVEDPVDTSGPAPSDQKDKNEAETSDDAELGGSAVMDGILGSHDGGPAAPNVSEAEHGEEMPPGLEPPGGEDPSPDISEGRSCSREPASATASPGQAPQEDDEAPPSQSASPKSESAGDKDKDKDKNDAGEDDPLSKHSVVIPSEYMKEAKDDPLAVFNRLMAAKDKEKGIVDSVAHYGAIRSGADVDHNPYGYPPPGHMYHHHHHQPPPQPAYGSRHLHHHHHRQRSPPPYDRPPHPRYAGQVKECYNCGRPDHLIRDCPKPLKWKRRTRTPSPFNRRRMSDSRSPSPFDGGGGGRGRSPPPSPRRSRRRSRRRTRSSDSSLSLSPSDEEEGTKKKKERKKRDKKRKRDRSRSKKKKRRRSSSTNGSVAASEEITGDDNEANRARGDEKRSVTLKTKDKAEDVPTKTTNELEKDAQRSDSVDAGTRDDVGKDVVPPQSASAAVVPQQEEESAKPKWKAVGDNQEKEENFPPVKAKAAIAIKLSATSTITSLPEPSNVAENPLAPAETPDEEKTEGENLSPPPSKILLPESHDRRDTDTDDHGSAAREQNSSEIHGADGEGPAESATKDPAKRERRSSPPRSYAVVAEESQRSPSPPPRRRRRFSPSPSPAPRRRSPSPPPARRSSRSSPPPASWAGPRGAGWPRARSPPFSGRRGVRGSGWPAAAPPPPPSHSRKSSPPRRIESPVRRRSRSPAAAKKRRMPKSQSPTPPPPPKKAVSSDRAARRGEPGAAAGESLKSSAKKGKKYAAASGGKKKKKMAKGDDSSSSSSSSSTSSSSSSSEESSDSELDAKAKKKRGSSKKKKKLKKDGKPRKGERKRKSKDKKKLKKKSKKAKKATKDLLDALLANHTRKVATALSEKGDLISISKMLKKKGLNLDSDDDGHGGRGGGEKGTRRVVLMTSPAGSPSEKRSSAKRDRRHSPEEEAGRKVKVGKATKVDKKLLGIKINITNDVGFGGGQTTNTSVADEASSASKRTAAPSDNETEYQSAMSKPAKASRRDTTESGEISEGNLEAEMYLLGKKYMNKSGAGSRAAAAPSTSTQEKKEDDEDDKKVGQLVDPESDGSPNAK